MDILMQCASGFQKLMDYEYKFTLGRKGKLTEIRLGFSDTDFHHLIGLHKLKDIDIARSNRSTIFHRILDGRITYAALFLLCIPQSLFLIKQFLHFLLRDLP